MRMRPSSPLSTLLVGLATAGVFSVVGVHLQAGQVPPRAAATAKPDRRVVDAVKAGDAAAVTTLLRQRVNVNTPEADGTTALHWATREDNLELAEMLIRAGADVKAVNRYGVTAISLAGVNGNAAMIERLLKAGIDVNAAGPEGETPLMTAARTGRIEAVKLLLDRGAAIDTKEGWHGQTALMWAAAQRHPAIVRELVNRGANVNARSNLEKWARQTTAEPREKWLPLGAMTPLLYASREGCVECADILGEAGADLNAADPDGITPAISAIINGHYDVAVLLVEKGADVNLADNTGRTALYTAVDFNSIPASNRPPPNVVPNRATSLDVIKRLLDRGANPNPRLKKQQPYRTKVDRGNDTMLGAGTTPFIRAAKAADVAAMRLLIAAGADPKLATGNDTAVDVSAATPARRGGGGINGLMAAAGVGSKEEDSTGRFKTETEIVDAIRICLEAGTDINAVESNGRTALHGAAQKGYDQVVRFLAERGARLDIKDRRGFTPLDAAMGLLGNGGFDGSRTDVHESTAALLRQLTATPSPTASAQP